MSDERAWDRRYDSLTDLHGYRIVDTFYALLGASETAHPA